MITASTSSSFVFLSFTEHIIYHSLYAVIGFYKINQKIYHVAKLTKYLPVPRYVLVAVGAYISLSAATCCWKLRPVKHPLHFLQWECKVNCNSVARILTPPHPAPRKNRLPRLPRGKKNASRQIGPRQIGPQTVGPRTIGPRTVGPRGPVVRGPTAYIQKAKQMAETICHPRKIGGKSA